MEERYFIKVNNVWVEAPQTKTVDNVTIYNYNSTSNHEMLIADGYTQERFINQSELHKKEVPEKISKLQLKIQLVRMGFNLQIIENAIATLPEPQKTFAYLSWTEATNFYRDDDMIASVGQMLNLTSEQIDELFIEAEKIKL